jgi:hypothetical protein
MSNSRLSARQSRLYDALDQLSSANANLTSILASLNSELTAPLRMRQDTGSNRVLKIDDLTVTNPQTGRKRSIAPIAGVIPTGMTFPISLTFPATSGAAIAISGTAFSGAAPNLTVSSGNWIKVGVNMDPNGNITLTFGTENASLAAATAPASIAGANSLGFVALQNVAGTISNVIDANVYGYPAQNPPPGGTDAAFSIVDDADPTRILKFSVGNIAAATTRTLTPPDASGTMAILGLAQTWTASQTILGFASIVDSNVSGYTALTTAMPGFELKAVGMNTTNKYTPALKFVSRDTDFTDTAGYRFTAGIVGRAEAVFTDASSPMGMEFLTTPSSGGANSLPTLAGYVSSSGAWTFGPAGTNAGIDVNGSVSATATGSTDSTFEANPAGAGTGTFITRIVPANDTGTTAAMRFAVRRNDNTAITTRPLFSWENFATEVGTISVLGAWQIGATGSTAGHTVEGGFVINTNNTNAASFGVKTGSALSASFITGGATGLTTGESTAASAMRVRRDTTTSRSISASGTINASGADYAEYMTKNTPSDVILPGEVCGVDAAGQLVKTWSGAISFVVKSTNPSYVGGDSWFSREKNEGESDEDYADAMETARQAVDRIAFCGQVPCIMTGAFTVGDLVLAEEGPSDTIQAVAISRATATLSQYINAIGRIWKDLGSGKALLAVGLK